MNLRGHSCNKELDLLFHSIEKFAIEIRTLGLNIDP